MKTPENITLLIKRIFDLSLASFGMILFLPVWAFITLAIFFETGRPIYYLQDRVGLNKKVFMLFKFRSMKKDAEKDTGAVFAGRNDKRITRFGKLLRKTAMDELPQLINIVKGDMSFVGPRAERGIFVDEFIKNVPGYENRFLVKPGLTGLAQIKGRYDSSPDEKLSHDMYYIENMNFLFDIKLILLSIKNTFTLKWFL